MYLDPGATSLVVQSLFALLATFLATFGRARQWFAALWTRATRQTQKIQRRNDQ